MIWNKEKIIQSLTDEIASLEFESFGWEFTIEKSEFQESEEENLYTVTFKKNEIEIAWDFKHKKLPNDEEDIIWWRFETYEDEYRDLWKNEEDFLHGFYLKIIYNLKRK